MLPEEVNHRPKHRLGVLLGQRTASDITDLRNVGLSVTVMKVSGTNKQRYH